MAPRPPKYLETAGKQLFKDLTKEYDFNPGELKLVLETAKTADNLAFLEQNWQELGRPTTALGSAKQVTIHPLVSEIRAQRAALASLLRQLRLPDEADDTDDNVTPMTRSEAARAAANGRWRRYSA